MESFSSPIAFLYLLLLESKAPQLSSCKYFKEEFTEYPFTGLIIFLYICLYKVRDWYVDSFRDIRSFPEVRSQEDELAFTQMIKMIRVRHTNVVPTIALGVQQLKKDLGGPKAFPPGIDEIHQFLDRFYMSRIGIRMLIG